MIRLAKLLDLMQRRHVNADDRRVLIARARRVFKLQHRDDIDSSDAVRQAYDAAVADLHAVCTPDRIYALATQRPLYGVPRVVDAWVEQLTSNLRALARKLSRDFVDLHERLDRQRETISKAHFALMSRIGVDWHSSSDDVTDGLADAIHFIADQRDSARDKLDQIMQQYVRPDEPPTSDGPMQLCGDCGHRWNRHSAHVGSDAVRYRCGDCDCVVVDGSLVNVAASKGPPS
jgi:hypothetical protein